MRYLHSVVWCGTAKIRTWIIDTAQSHADHACVMHPACMADEGTLWQSVQRLKRTGKLAFNIWVAIEIGVLKSIGVTDLPFAHGGVSGCNIPDSFISRSLSFAMEYPRRHRSCL